MHLSNDSSRQMRTYKRSAIRLYTRRDLGRMLTVRFRSAHASDQSCHMKVRP